MFSLNRQERHAIIFFAAVILSGIGISYSAKTFAFPKTLLRHSQNIGKLDLNRADVDALESARGIGPTLARRIIAYRQENGRFNTIEELKKIKGITRYRFEKIKGAFITE
jgi:competence ComEA-like helix-hairpin-helix protein